MNTPPSNLNRKPKPKPKPNPCPSQMRACPPPLRPEKEHRVVDVDVLVDAFSLLRGATEEGNLLGIVERVGVAEMGPELDTTTPKVRQSTRIGRLQITRRCTAATALVAKTGGSKMMSKSLYRDRKLPEEANRAYHWIE